MGRTGNIENIREIYGEDFFWNMETGEIIPYRLIKGNFKEE